MVVRFPHRLKYDLIITAEEAYQNENGDWVQSPPTVQEVFQACRMQPQGEGKTFKNQDGDDIEYSMIVYMPKGYELIPLNQDVEIFDGERKIGSGSVKRIHPSQLNVKAWL